MTSAVAPPAPRVERPSLPWRVLALLGLAAAILVGCGDDDPPSDTGGDGAGIEAEDGSTETSISGNEPDDGMNDDPESDDDAVTDGSGESGQGGQTGAAGGDSG